MARCSLERLLEEIRACRVCIDAPVAAPLPHEPRPVLRASRTARLAIVSQAPGVRVHASGVPFTDPSGDRLREWMGVTAPEFYDEARIAIVPMGFCFPGHDAQGGDLPPRRECAPQWRQKVIAALPQVEMVLLVGSYAQRWHIEAARRQSMTSVVKNWRMTEGGGDGRRYIPLPHPSWRNNAWIKKNPWFETDLIPHLRTQVRRLLELDAGPASRSELRPAQQKLEPLR